MPGSGDGLDPGGSAGNGATTPTRRIEVVYDADIEGNPGLRPMASPDPAIVPVGEPLVLDARIFDLSRRYGLHKWVTPGGRRLAPGEEATFGEGDCTKVPTPTTPGLVELTADWFEWPTASVTAAYRTDDMGNPADDGEFAKIEFEVTEHDPCGELHITVSGHDSDGEERFYEWALGDDHTAGKCAVVFYNVLVDKSLTVRISVSDWGDDPADFANSPDATAYVSTQNFLFDLDPDNKSVGIACAAPDKVGAAIPQGSWLQSGDADLLSYDGYSIFVGNGPDESAPLVEFRNGLSSNGVTGVDELRVSGGVFDMFGETRALTVADDVTLGTDWHGTNIHGAPVAIDSTETIQIRSDGGIGLYAFGGSVATNGKLSVGGELSVGANLDAQGSAMFAGPTMLQGATVAAGTLEVDGAATLGSTLSVRGDEQLGGRLNLRPAGADGAISFGSKANEWGYAPDVIRFKDGGQYAVGINIGGGGRTIVGAGESASNLTVNSGPLGDDEAANSTEALYLASDGYVYVLSNCNAVADRCTATFPKKSGTVALTSDLAGYATKADATSAASSAVNGINWSSHFSITSHTLNAGKAITPNGLNEGDVKITKAGWYPLGVIGLSWGSRYAPIVVCYLTGRASGSATIHWSQTNRATSNSSPTSTAYVLWAEV